MIALLLLAAAASASSTVASPTAHRLIVGAEHALQVDRFDQADVMASRALAAGASGPAMDRLLADLAFAGRKYPEALVRYEALLKADRSDAALLEAAGVAALRLGHVERAEVLLSAATSSSGATWRSWNALGVIADQKRDWKEADRCYERSAKLSPDEFEPLNNHGWSLVLRGNWKAAIFLFERAVALQPKSDRARDNLELARAALASDLPERYSSETDEAWAARLNDAGVAAATLGDKTRATAAFTQALEVNGTWYARAANNLETLGGR